MTASKSAIAAAKVAAALSDQWLHEDRLIAVAIGLPKHGASFLPHFASGVVPAFAGAFRPTEAAPELDDRTFLHVAGSRTSINYLDYCFFLGGKTKMAIWIGRFGDAKSNQIIRPVCVRFKKFGTTVGFIPSGWNGTKLPDRIAVWGLTPCGRIERHRRIPDGRNKDIFDTDLTWSDLVQPI
jgi:hypothetical protein